MGVADTAKKTGASKGYIYTLRSEMNKKKNKAKKPETQTVADGVDKADMVNSPVHYRVGGIEVIDFIEAKRLSYHLGNVVKYVCRSEYKGEQLQDLKKARWYLEREIQNLETTS
jgi:hypothetical protein